MGSRVEETAGLCPRPDDASLEEALGELDEKLAAYTAAMQEASAQLQDMAKPAQPPLARSKPATLPQRAGPKAGIRATAAPSDSKPAFGPVHPPSGPSQTGETQAGANDDEEILASLDAETAQAIRVMRRLTPGKASVRELLERYQAKGPAAVAGPSHRSSWLGRGR